MKLWIERLMHRKKVAFPAISTTTLDTETEKMGCCGAKELRRHDFPNVAEDGQVIVKKNKKAIVIVNPYSGSKKGVLKRGLSVVNQSTSLFFPFMFSRAILHTSLIFHFHNYVQV